MRLNLLSSSLFLVAGGILTQALLAGLFLSMSPGARIVHITVGAILPYLAIVPTVSAWRRASRGMVPRGVAVGTTFLMVGLWVQEALGHMPWPVTTAIHVPFGVLLFGLSAQLTFVSMRQPSVDGSVGFTSPGVTSPDS